MKEKLNFEFFSLLVLFSLIFLDAYSISGIPLQWVGSFLLFIYFLSKIRRSNLNLGLQYLFLGAIFLLPVVFEIFSNLNLIFEASYFLRIFSFISFFLLFYSGSNFFENDECIEATIKVFNVLLLIFSCLAIYFFTAQIFDLYEPFRSRSNTNLLGNSDQVTFWPFEPHRAMGTFREPVLFVSYIFPLYLVALFSQKNNFSILLISSIALGLTRSDLIRVSILIILICYILFRIKNINFRIVALLLIVLFFSFISINQCTINPASPDCKELSLSTSQPYTSFNDVSDIANLDEDRSNSLSFFVAFGDQIFSGGFQAVYSQYQNFVTQDIQKEMYLTNRTLPRYLNQRYSSENFGTGRYSSLFYVRNTQNLFVNLILSIGPSVLLVLFSYLLYLYLKSSNKFNFFIVFFVFLFFFINPFEELSAYMGFISALLVKMFAGSKNETST